MTPDPGLRVQEAPKGAASRGRANLETLFSINLAGPLQLAQTPTPKTPKIPLFRPFWKSIVFSEKHLRPGKKGSFCPPKRHFFDFFLDFFLSWPIASKNFQNRPNLGPDRPWALGRDLHYKVVYRGTPGKTPKKPLFGPLPGDPKMTPFCPFWRRPRTPLCASQIIFGKMSPLEMLFRSFCVSLTAI